MRALFALLLFGSAPLLAETMTSTDVSDVSVTIYRDPNRTQGAMDAKWPGGYALISETRTIRIPAGESIVRFEGVAEGMLPETAIVTGLPKGVREKNRDARLISPSGLVDAYLKRAVHLRRTNAKTGKVVEQDAIIKAGPNGGVILTTSDGVEALGCSGLPERMLYSGVPGDLSSKPTLSVLTSSVRETTATVQLTYMAQGFDWSANYVAQMDETGKRMGLFAWLTVANGGVQSFKNARMQVVAGQPKKEANAAPLATPDPGLHLKCWPMDITSTHPRYDFSRLPWGQQFLRTRAATSYAADCEDCDIIVTAQRREENLQSVPIAVAAITAQQEDLGDLKLYRVPIRVTVAAQSQKQVAMLNQPDAQFDRFYVVNVGDGDENPSAMPFLLRSKNVKEKGLGLPLPAGGVALFEPVAGNSLFAGEDDMSDLAIGEDVEIKVGQSPDVQWSIEQVREGDRRQSWRVTITNARAVPIRAEIIIPYELANKPKGLERGRGGWKLPVEVAANDSTTLDYTLKLDQDR